MDDLAWWLRIVGVLYLFMAFVSIGIGLARGYRRAPPSVWIVIHTIVIVSGLMCLGAI